MSEVKYSIVIPHKNTPELLGRCLSTVPFRDDLEIIIVDDNSDSSIVDFKNFPGKDRADVKVVFTKDGRGAGFARNEGLKIAKGHWIYFVDADDYLSDKFGLILDKYSNKDKLDMVFLNAVGVDNEDNLTPLSLNRYIRNYQRNGFKALDILRFQFWSPWSRLIRRELFVKNKIYFEEIPVSNDAWAILNASFYAKSFAVEIPVVYYYYKPSGGSQTKKAYNADTDIIRLEQRFRINELYSSAGYPFKWSIQHSFGKLVKSKDARVLQILSQYNYSLIEDTLRYLKYIFWKLTKII